MTPTRALHEAGQRLWLDNINRELLDSGTLRSYVEQLSVTGLTSNPTIFDQAFKRGSAYDGSLRAGLEKGLRGDALFFRVALEDLERAAALFLPVHEQTGGSDGWVSLEVSPLLAYDTAHTVQQATTLHGQAGMKNLFIKIPGTPEGLKAIEESTFAGIPINVTLLFSREQYLAAADAWMRGIERRLAAGRSPKVPSVASLFISRWDVAVSGKVPERLRNRLGIAVAQRTYRAYVELLASERARRLGAAGAPLQRLLWASTGTKDPSASDILYVDALVAPDTINTMPEATLLAFADHGRVGTPMARDGGDAESVLAEFEKAGVDVDALATRLQQEGAEAFVKSWKSLLSHLEEKCTGLESSRPAAG
ncbi:MAG: transaldolase [Myxococcaceae bacterium]|nr:transaldolase [Myxococcaceae bacterium]